MEWISPNCCRSGDTVFLRIAGEPASKANSRKLVLFGKRPASIKSEKARAWVDAAIPQIPVLDPLLDGHLSITCWCYYASNRPDLDPSLVFDVLQKRIITNDRQFREQHMFHAVDKTNPRVEVLIRPRQ